MWCDSQEVLEHYLLTPGNQEMMTSPGTGTVCVFVKYVVREGSLGNHVNVSVNSWHLHARTALVHLSYARTQISDGARWDPAYIPWGRHYAFVQHPQQLFSLYLIDLIASWPFSGVNTEIWYKRGEEGYKETGWNNLIRYGRTQGPTRSIVSMPRVDYF